MKVKCGKITDELKIYDDDGNEIDLRIAEASIEFKPNAMTVLRVDLYVDEVEVDAENTLITEQPKREPGSASFEEGLEAFEAGLRHDVNPYYPGKNLPEFLDWNAGWIHGRDGTGAMS